MDNLKMSTPKMTIIQSCRLFVRLIEGATTELHSSVIENMELLTKTEERACKLFLQKSGKCCQEILAAAENLFKGYTDTERESDTDMNESDTKLSLNIKTEPTAKETGDGGDEMFYMESLGLDCKNDLEMDNSEPEKLEDQSPNDASGDDTEHGSETENQNVVEDNLRPVKPIKSKRTSPVKRKAKRKVKESSTPKRRKQPKEFSCDTCEAIFESRKMLRSHLKEAHKPDDTDEGPFICETCAKPFKDRRTLYSHMKTHTMAYECETCAKRLATSYQLKCHMRIHTGEKPHVCTVCKMAFRTTTLLHTHTYNVHSRNKAYHCDQCVANFRFKHLLELHITKKHSDIRPFRCSVCGKGFVEKIYYDLHVVQHSGVRDFKCDQCEATFCTERGIKKHKARVHSEDHFVCDVCAKVFNHQTKLTCHMRVHTGEKRYSCDTCGKRFAWGHLLKQHMRLHTGEKPYQCDICQRQFLCSGNLSKHKKTHFK